LRLPVLQHHAVAFGNAVHLTISDYYREMQAGGKLTYKELIKKFKIHWQNEGFLSKDHEKESLKDGCKMLKLFYKNEKNRPCPKEIEAPFSFRISNDTITGRIDAIFEKEGKVRIIDFKSSTVDSKEKAYLSATGSLQLGIYALAYQELKGRLPDSVGLYFLGSGITGESKPTKRRIETVKKKIHEAREGIAAEIYDPKPSQFNCTYCAYSKICPYSEA
jgi:DNA helicase-2/ATP-dependent DNA helicase PcrA